MLPRGGFCELGESDRLKARDTLNWESRLTWPVCWWISCEHFRGTPDALQSRVMSADSHVGKCIPLEKSLSSVGFVVSFSFFFPICLFIFGCAGTLLLPVGSFRMVSREVGGLLWFRYLGFYCGDFSCCKAQTLGMWGLSSCGSRL